MKYLSLEFVDITNSHYPSILHNVNVAIRGTKNLFNIFFKVDDIEDSFGTTVPDDIDCTWLSVSDQQIEKYISYPILKRVLIDHSHPLVDAYLQWVDSLLFSNKVKPFYKNSFSSTECTLSDIDDSSSTNSLHDPEYLVTSLEHKVQQLEHALVLMEKDVAIMRKDGQLKNKEIELLRLQLSIVVKSEWI